MKKVLLFLTVMLLLSCNKIKSKAPLMEKEVPKTQLTEKEVEKTTSNNIVGKWISVNDRMVNDIVVSRVNPNTYLFKTTFKDRETKNENLTLNDKGEYHTNNRFGEYYKLRGKSLGIYDKQGLIAYYKKN